MVLHVRLEVYSDTIIIIIASHVVFFFASNLRMVIIKLVANQSTTVNREYFVSKIFHTIINFFVLKFFGQTTLCRIIVNIAHIFSHI